MDEYDIGGKVLFLTNPEHVDKVSDKHQFCRILLTQVRKDCKKSGIEIPTGLHAWAGGIGRGWHEVRDDEGNLIWDGNACCKWHARANALLRLLDKS